MKRVQILLFVLFLLYPLFPSGIPLTLVKSSPDSLSLFHSSIDLFGICKLSQFYYTIVAYPYTPLLSAWTLIHGLSVVDACFEQNIKVEEAKISFSHNLVILKSIILRVK